MDHLPFWEIMCFGACRIYLINKWVEQQSVTFHQKPQPLMEGARLLRPSWWPRTQLIPCNAPPTWSWVWTWRGSLSCHSMGQWPRSDMVLLSKETKTIIPLLNSRCPAKRGWTHLTKRWRQNTEDPIKEADFKRRQATSFPIEVSHCGLPKRSMPCLIHRVGLSLAQDGWGYRAPPV